MLRGRGTPQLLGGSPPRWETATYQQACKRAEKRPTGELYEWADMAVSGIGYHLTADRRDDLSAPDALHQAELALMALWAVIGELRIRKLSDRV